METSTVSTAFHEKKKVIHMQLWHIGHAGTYQLDPNQEQSVAPSSIAVEGLNILPGDDNQFA